MGSGSPGPRFYAGLNLVKSARLNPVIKPPQKTFSALILSVLLSTSLAKHPLSLGLYTVGSSDFEIFLEIRHASCVFVLALKS